MGCEEARRIIGDRLEFTGGAKLLGKIQVVESDLLEMEDGGRQRHSIVRGSRRHGIFLSIERFDPLGRPTFATFHSAEKVIVRFTDMTTLRDTMPDLEDMGLGWTVPFDYSYYPVAEFKVPARAEEFLGAFLALHAAVGARGRVDLVDIPPSEAGGHGVPSRGD